MAEDQTSSPTNDLQQLLRTAATFMAVFAASALVVYLWGESVLDGAAVWLTRLSAIALLGAGALSWRLPIKPVYLRGEEDAWYMVFDWSGRTAGFRRTGLAWITPVQRTEFWRRVRPLFIKHDVQAQNKRLDSFDVHLRIQLDVFPDYVVGASARWLCDQYPDGLEAMARAMLQDIANGQLRKITSFSQATETVAEASIRDAINSRLAIWEDKGVFVDEDVTFVDIMVSAELLMQRVKARAELSTFQTIRDVAHDMGITTDELLIERALERLPTSRSRQSVADVAAVLRLLRDQQPRLPDQVIDQPEPETTDQIEEATVVNGEMETPQTYVEGQYYPVDQTDPNDPDAEDGDARSVFSPF